MNIASHRHIDSELSLSPNWIRSAQAVIFFAGIVLILAAVLMGLSSGVAWLDPLLIVTLLALVSWKFGPRLERSQE